MTKTIQVKGASQELRTRLKSAVRNFRSLNQEALARLEFGFDIEDALVSKIHQNWIDQAMTGTFKRGSIAQLRQLAARARSAK